MSRDAPASDDALARRARDGDPRALAILYRRHAPSVLAYLERMFGERADAEDALHESFLKLFEGRGRYRGGQFRAWLFTVATRVAMDRARTAARRERIATAAADELAPAAPATPEERWSGRELAKRVDSALADLPGTHVSALLLRVREAFSYRQMAAITGEPEGTLRSRVHHSLRRVRRALGAPRDGLLKRSDER